jgi:hypothetical protein
MAFDWDDTGRGRRLKCAAAISIHFETRKSSAKIHIGRLSLSAPMSVDGPKRRFWNVLSSVAIEIEEDIQYGAVNKLVYEDPP